LRNASTILLGTLPLSPTGWLNSLKLVVERGKDMMIGLMDGLKHYDPAQTAQKSPCAAHFAPYRGRAKRLDETWPA